MALPLTVYGVPLSPPFRSVIWTLLQRRQAFKVQLVVPGASTKIGSRGESFLAKTRGRTGIVPVLEDESITLSESPAILMYLCETRSQFSDLYGKPGTQLKAHIDEYLHWHHGNTKRISALTMPYIRPELRLSCNAEAEEKAHTVLRSLDEAWLRDDPYVASTDHHSIADMIAYEEVAQASFSGAIDLSQYPKVTAWSERMTALPFHKEAHASLTTLGSLIHPSPSDAALPMMKRLGAATKEGLLAIQAVQDSFASETQS
jgi:glutathione S-transferase